MACALFGSDNSPDCIMPALEDALINAVNSLNIHDFMVGDSNSFDRMAYAAAVKVSRQYMGVRVQKVLDHQPSAAERQDSNVVCPEEIMMIKPEYLGRYRDRWMLHLADYLIVYYPESERDASDVIRYASGRSTPWVNLARIQTDSVSGGR